MAKITRGVSHGESKSSTIMIDDGIWWKIDDENTYHKFILQETSEGSGLYVLKDVAQESE